MNAAARDWKTGSGGVPRGSLQGPLALLEPIAEHRVFQAGTKIYTWGDRTGYWYRLGSGAAKRQAVGETSHLQVVDFVFPGDWFGLSIRVVHEFATEIITPRTVLSRYPYTLIQKTLHDHPRSMLELIDAAFRATSRLQRHMRVLVRGSPEARLGGFLLEMARRCGDASGVVVLPMPLHDVANYLLLSDDAVSQALLHWVANGAIELLGERRLCLLDAAQLDVAR